MAILKFIGLANYTPVINNLVNIIFTSTQIAKTTYQYKFSDNKLTEQPEDWIDISTLTDVTIPANTEISAQLDTGDSTTAYYLYIKEKNGTGNIIWQQSTDPLVYVPNTSVPSAISDISDYTTGLVSYTTNDGGSINTAFVPIGIDAPITSNIIYSSIAVTINMATYIYENANPLFIMSNNTITLSNTLTTNNGSINIVGWGADGDGIYIHASITITGNVTLNGTGGADGIYINASITNDGTGNVTLNGTGGAYGDGIFIGAAITISGNVTLNGTGGTDGIYIDADIIITGNVTLNGTGGTNYGIYIDAAITNNGIGNVILNGTGDFGIYINASITNDGTGNVTLYGTGTLHGIYIGASITISGNVTLNGTGTNYGIYIDAAITNNGIGNVTLYGTGEYGIYINASITNDGTGNVTLYGTGTLYGIYINASITNNGIGNVMLNGTGGTYGIFINGGTITNNGIGNVILNGTGGAYGIFINGDITITGNVTLNGTGTVYGIYIGESITNTSTGNVILYGTGAVGIFIYSNAAITNTSIGNVTLNGTGAYGIFINASITNTGSGNVTLNGKGTGTYCIVIYADITISGTVTLNGTGGTYGIFIDASITNNGIGNVILNGTGEYGIYIGADIIITGNVTLNIKLDTNNILGNIYNNGTISGKINIGINPASILTNNNIYTNVISGIPDINLDIINGSFTNPDSSVITWRIEPEGEHNSSSGYRSLSTGNACLLAGTMILTPSGEIPIENIHVGYSVITSDNRIVKVISVYHITFINNNDLYIIKQHSIDVNIPNKDLYISKGHLVNIHGKYFHAIHDKSNLIHKCDGNMEISFYHLELENYITDFLVANGVEVESKAKEIPEYITWDCSGEECVLLIRRDNKEWKPTL